MNHSGQLHQLLPRTLLRYFFLLFVNATSIVGCSKTDQLNVPGKNLQQSRDLNFAIVPENIYEEDASRKVAVKLKITVSALTTGAIQKQVLWDTLISSNSLYDYLRICKTEQIKISISADPETLRHLLVNYLAVYSHDGNINTRSGSVNRLEEDKAVRIGL